MRKLITFAAVALAACSTTQQTAPQDYGTVVPSAWPFSLEVTPTVAPTAMVATDAPIATDVGVQVMRDGGNAIDAAVATAFALAVVYPEAGNIGGGGFMVARMADGTSAALDFREKAPLAATRDMYLDAAGNLTDRSVIGHLASGVPGAVMGLQEAHRRFGTKPWVELLEPAIALGPLDGRYRSVVAPLTDHLSEAALNRARLDVEVSWLIHLTTTGALPRTRNHAPTATKAARIARKIIRPRRIVPSPMPPLQRRWSAGRTHPPGRPRAWSRPRSGSPAPEPAPAPDPPSSLPCHR